MTLGGKYKWKPDENPAPGQYECAGAVAAVKPRSKAAIIREKDEYQVPRENSPAPGQYDSHLKDFGTNDRKMTLGGKYKWKPDENPAAGQYEPNHNVIKPSASAPKLVSPQKPPKRVEHTPGPNESFSRPFGDDAPTFSMGIPRPVRIERSPGPGEYDLEKADSLTKPRIIGGRMHKETEITIDQDALPPHLKNLIAGRSTTISQSASFVSSNAKSSPKKGRSINNKSFASSRPKSAVLQKYINHEQEGPIRPYSAIKPVATSKNSSPQKKKRNVQTSARLMQGIGKVKDSTKQYLADDYYENVGSQLVGSQKKRK